MILSGMLSHILFDPSMRCVVLLPGPWWLFRSKRMLCIPLLQVDWISANRMVVWQNSLDQQQQSKVLHLRVLEVGLPCHPQLLWQFGLWGWQMWESSSLKSVRRHELSRCAPGTAGRQVVGDSLPEGHLAH